MSLGGKRVEKMKAMRNLALVGAMALAVTGCSKELILDGLREDIRSPGYDTTDPQAVAGATEVAGERTAPFENQARAISLGAAGAPSSWTHRGANAQHSLPHATLSAQPVLAWSASAGAGNERKYRITAEPVAEGGRVFTMDSHANVMAHAVGGATLWSANLTAPGERDGTASGGGLALGDGKLFATTTQGELVALDPASGNVLWRQKFEAAVNGAPTVSGGQVFVTTGNSVAYAVNTDTGRIGWRLAGVPTQSGVSGTAAPAVSGNIVLFPLANGSMLGVDAANGTVRWNARVAGDRPGRARRVLQAFTGEPVVSGDMVFAATASGRAVAIGLNDGRARWNVEEGAQGTMSVAGGSVFFVNDEARLVRLSAASGEKIWEVALPRYERADKPRKLKSVWPAFGPVLASGRVWIASGDGFLRAFNPEDGTPLGIVELPAGAASRPIIVGGMMMLMTEKGDLIGMR
ncbi:PQQ-binding-like beta-propeller repeat protein [Sinisalibacter aestuarii]|uniref:Pyrrolo-quinoline quinone n=1 Tax=Sinisalibacter aestuarii TaxID=2949426 RepID=A0ABQ5LVN3_9RHOB|nr:PQQ-binding-like beta-propeller repeat protein [Sinisalibacter aestuarii]GKY89041.1 pyrrolo-quinoline quinone [Sinisalibacter aestuarii]